MSGNWKLETWRELRDRTVWMLHDEGYATSIEGPDEDGDLRIEVEEKGYGTVHTYVPAIEVAALLRKIGWTVTAPANQTPGAPSPSHEEAETWYEANGSAVMLPADEVKRRRKLAAKVLEAAREVATAMEGVRFPLEHPGWQRLMDLRARLYVLDHPAPTSPGTDAAGGES